MLKKIQIFANNFQNHTKLRQIIIRILYMIYI